VSSVKEALSQAYNAGMENKTTVGKHEVKYTDWSDECEAICHLVCVEGDEEGEEMYYERVCNDCGTVNYSYIANTIIGRLLHALHVRALFNVL